MTGSFRKTTTMASSSSEFSDEEDVTMAQRSPSSNSSSDSSGGEFVQLIEQPMASPPRKKSKATSKKTSWTYAHFRDLSNLRRLCKLCPTSYATSTGTGTLATHLMTHGVRKNSVPAKRSLQLTMEGSTALGATTKLHSLVTTYIVQGMLLYSHVESAAFKALLSGLVPGYKPPTASTVKRRLLAMYIVLKCMITEYLISLSVALSVTIDGWSNQVCRGYFACTLHWMDTRIEQLCSCTLDFFYVAPGEGVSHRCGHYLTALFTTFGISSSTLAIVSDSGSDAIAAANVVVAASVATASQRWSLLSLCTCVAMHTRSSLPFAV